MNPADLLRKLALVAVTLLISAGVSTGNAAGSTAEHCVVKATNGGTGVASASEPICFATFAEAISYATGGAIQLPVDAPAGDYPELRTQSLQSSYVVGIDWEHINQGGSSFVITMSSPCNGGNGIASNYPSNWNDRISSAEAYAGCTDFLHYEHINFGGAVLDCASYCSSMGIMNDQSSSYWID